MDWNQLKQKALPFVEKAKDYGFKAIDFSQKQLKNTDMILRTEEEFLRVTKKRRAIVLAYDETTLPSKELLLRVPLWGAQAWTDTADFRLISFTSNPEFREILGAKTNEYLAVWFDGRKTFEASSPQDILAWWKDRCYDGVVSSEPAHITTSPDAAPPQEASISPRAEKTESAPPQ